MSLLVRRGDFSIEDPWVLPPGCEWIALTRSADGSTPRLPTSFALYSGGGWLHVLFRAEDRSVVATYLRHDDPLYEEDVVELFLAPGDPRRYYEIEVNPLGTTFDARIESPDGIRDTMRADRSWDCEGLFAAIRKVPGQVETVIRFPFISLGVPPPAPGAEWRGNFFRIDRDPEHGDEFSAWQPTRKNPPDFHVVAAFGRIVFA